MKNLKYRSQSAAFVLIVLGFIVVANYVSTKMFVRLDFTENKVYSISDATKDYLKKLDDIVNVKVYFSKDLPPHLKTIETDVKDLLSEYKAYAGKNLRVSYEDPSKDEETKSRVRSLGIPEIQMQTFEKDKAQVTNGFLGIAVMYLDKKEVLPVVQNMRNFEYDLTMAIMKVFRESAPKIGVLKTDTSAYLPPRVAQRMNINATDNTEETYKPIFDNLRNYYDVQVVDISEGQSIPQDMITLIVPGGDDHSFTDRDLFEIDQYFMNGGNLMVLADAVDVDFSRGISGSTKDPKILSLLSHYGARVEKNMVLDANCGQVQVPQRFGAFQMNVAVPYPYFVRVTGDGFKQENPAVSSLGELMLPWASSITLLVDKASDTSGTASSNVEAQVLAHSSDKSWTASDHFNLNPQQDWTPPESELKKSNLVAYLSGTFTSYFDGKQVPPVQSSISDTSAVLKPEDAERPITPKVENGRLLVVGDSDFLSKQNATPGNLAFLLNVVDWLSLDESLISVRSRNTVDRTIRQDQLEEGSSLPTLIRFINIFLMPAIVVIIGLVIFWKRREKSMKPKTQPVQKESTEPTQA